MAGMVDQFEQRLEHALPPHLTLFRAIKSKLRDYAPFDIEALIRVLDHILAADPQSSLNDPAVHYFSDWGHAYEAMTKYKQEDASKDQSAAKALLTDVKRFVAEVCVVKSREFQIYDAFLHQVLSKVGYNINEAVSQQNTSGQNYQIFTTNYDPIVEAFFDDKGLPYECGEGRNGQLDIKASNSDLFNLTAPRFQIYKLHGSVNWYQGEQGRLRCGTNAAESGSQTLRGDQVINELMIYPATQKYTFREPFYDMFHHLKQCLMRSQTCYIVGYSFRDEDILGVFHDALGLNASLSLCLIDPDAGNIIRSRFPNHQQRINSIPSRFSVEAVNGLP